MKTTLFTSGFPHVYQPYESVVLNFEDSIKKVLAPFGDCIVSGFEEIGFDFGTLTYTYSEGIVFFKGEPLYVPAHSTVHLPIIRQLYFERQTIDVSNYPVAHADGEVRKMVVENIGKVVSASSGNANRILLSDLPRFGKPNWTVVTPETGSDFSTVTSGEEKYKLSYVKDNNDVVVRGGITITATVANNSAQTLFILPAGFRPITIGNTGKTPVYTNSGKLLQIEVLAGGQFRIINKSGASMTNQLLVISDYRFRID